MGSNIIRIKDFSPKSSQQFLFDTNIWLFLYCPISNYKKIKQTISSNFLARLLSINCKIFITSLIISEFSNAYLRMDYRIWLTLPGNSQGDFKKDYFHTDSSILTRKSIESSIKQILRVAEKYPDNFNNVNLDEIFKFYESIDYNDSFILAQSLLNKWHILTDDSDFEKVNTDVQVIKLS